MEKYYLFTFDSTHHAILAETFLRDSGIKNRVIGLPGEISSGCGLSITVAPEDFEESCTILKGAVVVSGYYKVSSNALTKSKNIEKINQYI